MTYDELANLILEEDLSDVGVPGTSGVYASVRLGLVKAGQDKIVNGWKGDLGVEFADSESALEKISELYADYVMSVPETLEQKSDSVFQAPSLEELELGKLEEYIPEGAARGMSGICRKAARNLLEAYVIAVGLSGRFKWDEQRYGKWVWRSSRMPKLVVMREWLDRGYANACPFRKVEPEFPSVKTAKKQNNKEN